MDLLIEQERGKGWMEANRAGKEGEEQANQNRPVPRSFRNYNIQSSGK